MSKAPSSQWRELVQASTISLAIVVLTAVCLRLSLGSRSFQVIQPDEAVQFANSLQLRRESGNR
ncbi:hypothetical protein H6G20_17525 [Desertifilum sp. FACHB-1129]|uniref:Uncharacterized protein n=2 Tax=Desertifilum tharense IPPAS B-1220 TaxID=1781255 RepID=A0A1E5QHG2_9CYAN|nr:MULTISPECIES: hypothetical protein [Desertifilum]MCD8486920.1 hypothetical protein [Desertifilum sp.]MDA0210925.1 hypothetical protein [Cyanobacteria bacterium FC1]MBD2313472.1 hypothetical protein [Desertifilum sp. FACHB-1129]MBD2322342.1 hypothetical protein [Desertifilum sp. FACHB-866]MBD2332504.1 hypothetical protein [Desertifilum sp. FACHB-868]